jgi:hypothetical protein
MNQIKFSKCSYCKLPQADRAILKYATVIKLEEQTHAFLDYDTTYIEFGEVKKYPLPSCGDYLLLLFIGNGAVFTTLRRATHEKAHYYLSKIGEEFEIVIEDKEVSK